MSTWANLGHQDSASPLIEQLIFFHDHALLIMVMITVLVGYLMFTLLFKTYINRILLEGQFIEMIWTILPAINLLFSAFPSLRLLYLLDEINEPSMTLKSIEHQCYWNIEYSDFNNIEFDSYMIPTNELTTEGFRLLDVDSRVVLPMNSQIRILVTVADVIHSWTIPALGVKVNGTPGRLNQSNIFINRPGLLYGQCSEICGAKHSFMSIVIESVPVSYFIKWISNKVNSTLDDSKQVMMMMSSCISWKNLSSTSVTIGLRWGMILFILSGILFFVSIFWAFFHSSLSPAIELGASL